MGDSIKAAGVRRRIAGEGKKEALPAWRRYSSKIAEYVHPHMPL
jgi:hypothetical protein